MQKLSYAQFFTESCKAPLIDVRTPAEFNAGHIPGAHHVPLFTNEQRVLIGTAYKQQGKQVAMKMGLDCVAPRMKIIIESIETILEKQGAQTNKVVIHCWRGGMRSASVAQLCQFFGQQALVLEGGYKAYRAWVREQFIIPRQVIIVGGPTGAQKTELLKTLAQQEQVIDLESIAGHHGSVFGGLGKSAQPTQEQFENDLAAALALCNPEKRIFIEDESRKIGSIFIPDPFFKQMRTSPLIIINRDIKERSHYLCKQYGTYQPELLLACAKRLEKHLGGARLQEIISLQSDTSRACDLLIRYYDKLYAHGIAQRKDLILGDCDLTGLSNDQAVTRIQALLL